MRGLSVELSTLVMAKAPRPGSAKTRLEPLLGGEGCAALQAELIGVVTAWAAAVSPGRAHVACGPDAGAVAEVAAWAAGGVEAFADGEGDLGDRLAAASGRVLDAAPGPLLVVGTDMPMLRERDGEAAAEQFDGGADVVLGPALDGGYWLVGLARPVSELFELGAEWGGQRVLERTLEIASGLGLRVGLLDERRDLDDPEDARALLADPALPDGVAGVLRRGGEG